jgi:Leu/Phe-tRNA-protein transferase
MKGQTHKKKKKEWIHADIMKTYKKLDKKKL